MSGECYGFTRSEVLMLELWDAGLRDKKEIAAQTGVSRRTQPTES